MDENLLLIAFGVFAVIIFVVSLVLRRMTVDDIFSDDKASSMSDLPFSNRQRDVLPSAPTSSLPSTRSTTGSGTDSPTFELNRQNLNRVGKILGVVGAVMIFVPLPDTVHNIGFGVAFIGYLLTRFTNPPKGQKTGTAKVSTVNTLRTMAGKPEYREVMQILSADMADKSLVTDTDRRRRAIHYLESKGVSTEEANRNVTILAGYMAQQRKK